MGIWEPDEAMAAVTIPVYALRTCPNCGKEVFADMDRCYECLGDLGVPVGDSPWDEERVPTESYAEAMAFVGMPPGDEAGSARLSLHIVSPGMEVTVPLSREGVVIGRGSACDVVLHERSVSRQHVRIEPGGGAALVRDLGATNRAMVNGVPVDAASELGKGDLLVVGSTRIKLC